MEALCCFLSWKQNKPRHPEVHHTECPTNVLTCCFSLKRATSSRFPLRDAMINNSFIITASLLLSPYFLLEAVQHYCRADGDSLNCQIIEIPAYLVEPSLLLLWSLLSGFIVAGKAPFFSQRMFARGHCVHSRRRFSRCMISFFPECTGAFSGPVGPSRQAAVGSDPSASL